MSETCCTRLAENIGRKNYAKNRHLRTILSGYIFATKACIDNRKKSLLNSNTSMVNIGPLTAEICWRVWGTPANFNRFFASWLCYCSDVAHRRPTKLCTIFGRLLGWYTIYILWGFLPLTEFYQVQSSLCVEVLRSRVLAALLQGTPAAGVSQTLWRTRNGITELSQRAPPIFGLSAITLPSTHIIVIFYNSRIISVWKPLLFTSPNSTVGLNVNLVWVD